MEHEIALAAEKIVDFGFFSITNTLLFSWLTMGLILTFAYFAGKKMRTVPNGFQNVAEAILEPLYNMTTELAHNKTKIFFPIITTFFLYILVANWLGLLPGVGTITVKPWSTHEDAHLVPLFRSIYSDFNMTLGLGLISIAITHIFAVKFLGVGGYLKKWFSLNPIFLFVGLLELVGEFTKILSLSLRLFGNIFAGEVVLTSIATISKFTAFLVPLPFYLLELIVGVVQALVFTLLTLAFMVLLTTDHSTEH